MDSKKLAERYWACMGSGQFDQAGTCMTADAHVYFPNTQEVFKGRDAFVAFNEQYPGKWSVRIEKLIVLGDTVVTAVRVDSEDGEMGFYAASFFTIRDGLIKEITEYWGENGEPPRWRQDSPYVERY